MIDKSDGRLQRLLGGDPLAALRKRLRQRYERAATDAEAPGFRISNLNADEHAALAGLLGRSPRFSGSLHVDTDAIDAALQRAGIAKSLRDALEQIDGPIINRAAHRDFMQMQWSQVRDACDHPGLSAWLQAPAGLGLLKRLSGQNPETAARLLAQVQAVLRQLPAPGVTRAQLAANVLGNAHALDTGYAVATLLLASLRRAGAAAPAEEDAAEDATDISARDVWASVGVLVNELARPALVLNLPVHQAYGQSPSPGEPTYMSLRTLLRSPPCWQVSGLNVYICENPNLLAIAADHLGAQCAPLVCTDGMPAAAQRTLLAQLVQAGAKLRYHGDFDWPGLRIGNYVMREYGAQAWRFAATDYVAAMRTAPRPGRRLEGTQATALWDAALAPVMHQEQLAIDEEAVADHLLLELGSEPIP